VNEHDDLFDQKAKNPRAREAKEMRRTAVLFDLDGTLVDSLPDLAAGVNGMLGGLGRPALDHAAIARMIGDGVPKLVERSLAASGVTDIPVSAAIERFRAIYEADPTKLTRPYPDVTAILQLLTRDHRPLAVCTNKIARATQAVLDGLALTPFFAIVVGGDTLPHHKPDPAQLVFALDRLGVAPADAAMLGDHRNDVLAARAAGTKAIFARYGYGQASLGDLKPDATIDRFAELPAALGALGF
jgi:phosphoglycolate phosphatase